MVGIECPKFLEALMTEAKLIQHETVVIDALYKGVKKDMWGFFRIDEDIIYPNAHIKIKIPLCSSKSIEGLSIKSWSWSLEVEKSLKAACWIDVCGELEVGGDVEAGESIYVYKFLKVGGGVEAGKRISVGGYVEVSGAVEAGEYVHAGERLKVGKFLKTGWELKSYGAVEVSDVLEVFGEKTTKYAYIPTSAYPIVITSSYIKVGHQLHKVEEWESFTDDEIAKMDHIDLEWWKKWKKFVLSTHENLVEEYGVEK